MVFFLMITTIINMSMQDGVLPDDFKPALVNPLIKKQKFLRKKWTIDYRVLSYSWSAMVVNGDSHSQWQSTLVIDVQPW